MDDIKKWQEEFLEYASGLNLPRDDFKGIMGYIEEAPAVKPEPLTDKEQRIFLTAMAREEKVCKQVDDECRDRTPYEVSLVHICREIRRKVKGALWT